MEGVRPRQRLHETPVFMRVRRTPSFVTMRLLVAQSQWEIRDFHNFLGILCQFCRFLPVFARICWFSWGHSSTPRLTRPLVQSSPG